MGRFSKTTQVKNDMGRDGFISAFNDVMAKRGFVPCSEDEAAKSYLLAFSDGWVTFTSESEDVPQVVKEMNVTSFSVEVVDSDFAILTLNNGDTVIFGDGSGYGIEDSPKGERKFWEPLLADGKTWEQFCEARDKNEVFVEDALCEAAPILGIDTKYIIEDYNELLDMAGSDKNIETLYFKEKAADKKSKPMTLNAAFVKVFGEALEPLGFKRLKNIKNKQPYYVRVVGDEILHIITYRQTTSYKKGYKNFEILGGVATLYRRNLDFLYFTYNPQDWLINTNHLFRAIPDLDVDRTVMENAIQFKCDIWGTDKNRILKRETLNGAFLGSIGNFLCSSDDGEAMLYGLKNAFNITKSIILAVIDKVTDLDSCINYFYISQQHGGGMNLCPFDEFITDKICSEGLILIKAGYRDDGVERIKKEAITIINSGCCPVNSEDDYDKFIEEYVKQHEDYRVEQVALRDEMLDNPELNRKVMAELKRCKANNIEILKSYGLTIDTQQ